VSKNANYSDNYSDSIQRGCRGEFIRPEQAMEKANKFAPQGNRMKEKITEQSMG
jgi:hypothetical protein